MPVDPLSGLNYLETMWIEHYQSAVLNQLKRKFPFATTFKISKPPAGFLTPFQKEIAQLKYWIAVGIDDADTFALTKKLATDVYDNHLDRHVCEITGNTYFHQCNEDW